MTVWVPTHTTNHTNPLGGQAGEVAEEKGGQAFPCPGPAAQPPLSLCKPVTSDHRGMAGSPGRKRG